MTAQDLQILGVWPSIGVAGGVVLIRCTGFEPGLPSTSRVKLGEMEAEIVSASADAIVVRLPDNPHAFGFTLRIGETLSQPFAFSMARRLASELHIVMNPVVAPDGSIITTISGSRGEQIAQPLIRVSRQGEKTPFPCEIMNPTGLAFGPDGQLYISSRNDGVVFRYKDFQQLETVASDLGIPCGIAFDSQGNMYVGDRSGKIYRLDPAWNRSDVALLEPSVSAFHLAVDAQDRLYVTGPTLSTRDSLYRVLSNGAVEVVLSGLARPQGMAILKDESLLLAASYKGKKGVFKVNPAGAIAHYIAAPTMVGIALSDDGIILADNASLYRIQVGGMSSRIS